MCGAVQDNCLDIRERDGVGCGSRKGIVGNKVEKVESWGGGSVSDSHVDVKLGGYSFHIEFNKVGYGVSRLVCRGCISQGQVQGSEAILLLAPLSSQDNCFDWEGFRETGWNIVFYQGFEVH
ncbi:hypothetical protein QL285_042587 [Trifolium repens]|nr:hypothetical protein QL285_042587 [Trifolium repens]